jgi:hypothetical protein
VEKVGYKKYAPLGFNTFPGEYATFTGDEPLVLVSSISQLEYDTSCPTPYIVTVYPDRLKAMGVTLLDASAWLL